jgi:PTS system mannose-specific IIA component
MVRDILMAGIFIIAHAPLASSLRAVAQHVYPDCGQSLHVLDVPPDIPADEIERQARDLLAAAGDQEALILTDVFGATPCNVALRLADGVRVRVVAGVNVPMLWRTLCYANEPLDSVVTRAVAGATQGVMQVTPTRPQNQTPAPRGHDQVSNHHQQ